MTLSASSSSGKGSKYLEHRINRSQIKLPYSSNLHRWKKLPTSVSSSSWNSILVIITLLAGTALLMFAYIAAISYLHDHQLPVGNSQRWKSKADVLYKKYYSLVETKNPTLAPTCEPNCAHILHKVDKVYTDSSTIKTENAASLETKSGINGSNKKFETRRQSPETLENEQVHVLDLVESTLRSHPLHKLSTKQQHSFSFDDYFIYLSQQQECKGSPIFTSMANVFSELYWQLIENFIYSMVKFNLSSCALMICVSDTTCLQRCARSNFPCIDFQYGHYHPELTMLPSALEQIAELKLFHIPKALLRGVDVMLLDLDVGFLSSPRNLMKVIKPNVDAYVQKDVAHVMNRSLEGWKTWYTIPLPNIGLFFVRGNKKTAQMFDLAWQDYKSIPESKAHIKINPGKDQNKVANAMKMAQYSFKMNWKYFPAGSAILLDMMYKYNDPRYEIGGIAAHSIFTLTNVTTDDAEQVMEKRSKRHTMSKKTSDVGKSTGVVYAVHTTCYEQKTKVMGLKASNAFWNPYYYKATRRTITKPLIFITEEQLRHEVRTLLYLGYVTNRSVIIPNILGNEEQLDMDTFRGRALWPGFRVVYFFKDFPHTTVNINILEPAFYWRVERDYFQGKTGVIPKPKVFNMTRGARLKVIDVERALNSDSFKDEPRIVLSVNKEELLRGEKGDLLVSKYHQRIADWALDSVGKYLPYAEEYAGYDELPRINYLEEGLLQKRAAMALVQKTRLCANIFQIDHGNRSCFNKCK